MKRVAGKLKLELAQFAELEAFSQFASDLDQATQNQLARGKRLREILKQPQYSPVSLENQVGIIFAGTNGYLDKVDMENVSSYLTTLQASLQDAHSTFGDIILSTNDFTKNEETVLREILENSATA